jgi:hypothetical protein
MALAALLIISTPVPATTTSAPEKFDFNQTEQPSGNHDFILHTDGQLYHTEILQFDSLSEHRLHDRPGLFLTLSSRYEK